MFTCLANDAYNSFPTSAFASVDDAVLYGLSHGKPFTVAAPSGAVAATKAYADSEVVVYV